MKTIKITLITSIIALGAFLFGQADKEPDVYMPYAIEQADIIYEENYDAEDWMTTPFESRYADVDLAIEDWMTRAFESTYAEADMAIEDWMTNAFESNYAEADLSIEDWMTNAFETADHIEVERWMTAAF